MSAQDDSARLVAILTDIAGPDRTPARVARETAIGEDGFWLDSADLLEVLLACEQAFAVALDPAAILGQDRRLTVGGLLAAIDAARQG